MFIIKDPRISRQVSQTLAKNVIEIHKTTTASGGTISHGSSNVGHMSNNNSNTDSSNTTTSPQSKDGKSTAKLSEPSKTNQNDIKKETHEPRYIYKYFNKFEKEIFFLV